MTLIIVCEGNRYTFPNIWHRYISRAIMGVVYIERNDLEKARGRLNSRGYGLKILESDESMLITLIERNGYYSSLNRDHRMLLKTVTGNTVFPVEDLEVVIRQFNNIEPQCSFIVGKELYSGTHLPGTKGPKPSRCNS